MYPAKRHTSRTKPAASITDLSVDAILYLAKFMCFKDYRNLIRSMGSVYTNNTEIRKKLWQLSLHKSVIKFINGKELEIEYNFNSSRIEKERVLFKVSSLLPVFGGITPRKGKKFMSASNLENFIKMHIHMDMCHDISYADCPCRLANENLRGCERFIKPIIYSCKNEHFHHYCSDHVKSWLNHVQSYLIHLQEKKKSSECYEANTMERNILLLDEAVFYQGVDMRLRGSLLYKLV